MAHEKPVIATILSKDDDATTRDGMPFEMPKPPFCRKNIWGVMTAGAMAARMKPRDEPRAKGMPKTAVQN